MRDFWLRLHNCQKSYQPLSSALRGERSSRTNRLVSCCGTDHFHCFGEVLKVLLSPITHAKLQSHDWWHHFIKKWAYTMSQKSSQKRSELMNFFRARHHLLIATSSLTLLLCQGAQWCSKIIKKIGLCNIHYHAYPLLGKYFDEKLPICSFLHKVVRRTDEGRSKTKFERVKQQILHVSQY